MLELGAIMRKRKPQTNVFNDDTFRVCLNACIANARTSGDLVEVRDSDTAPYDLKGHSTDDNVPVLHGTPTYPAIYRPDDIVLPTPAYLAELERDRAVLLSIVKKLWLNVDYVTSVRDVLPVSNDDRALELFNEATRVEDE